MFISPSRKKRELSLLAMVAVFSVCCITSVVAQNVTVPPIHDTPRRIEEKRSRIGRLPDDKYDGPYVPFYYKPRRTDAQIEEAFQKASAKKSGPSIRELAGFALEFGRNGNTKRQQELIKVAMTKIEAITDDVRRAKEWLSLASIFRSKNVLGNYANDLVRQEKTDEAAAFLLEMMQTAKDVEPESVRNEILLQITFDMKFHQFFDEVIESTSYFSDPEIRNNPVSLMDDTLCALPGSHSAKAVAKILEMTTPEDVIWWRAKTADAVLKFRDDPSRLKDAFSKLLADSLDANVKNKDNQEENGFSDNMTIVIMETAFHSDCFQGMSDIVLALQGTPDQADKVRLAKIYAFCVAISYSMLDSDVFNAEKLEERSTILNDFPKYFTEYNLADTREKLLLQNIVGLMIATGNIEHLKPLLEQLEKSVNKITDAQLKDELRVWFGELQAQAGMTEDALATAKQVDDPNWQGYVLVMVANSHYRYIPTCQWPEEMRSKTEWNEDNEDDFDKIRTQPKPEDVRKTVDAIIQYVASIKDKEHQQTVLNTMVHNLRQFNIPYYSNEKWDKWNCGVIFIDALRQSESFAPDVKRQYVKQLDEKP